MAISFEAFPPTRPTRLYSSKMPGICTVRDFTIRSNTNGLGLRSNAIKDLFPLILVGWIGKAHGPTLRMVEIGRKAKLIWTPESFGQYSHVLELRIALKLNFS